MDSGKRPIIVGATVTHNAMDNIHKVVASLKSVCDIVLAFDDASTDGTASGTTRS